MRTLVLLALLGTGCEHDPRYEHKPEHRPVPAADAPPTPEPEPPPLIERTIERPTSPKIVPLRQRTHRRHKS